jgi:hypothetical protein
MEEAYAREECSVGFWPSSESHGPMFYAYAYPEPGGYENARIRPAAATFDPQFGEFILPWHAVRGAADPDGTVLSFFQSTYEAGADLGGWDRALLEPATSPGRPPDRPWSALEE